MGFIFKSNPEEFLRKHEALKDMAQGHMVQDIETIIKIRAGTPVKTGAMKADVRHFKNSDGHWRVEAGKAYSAYQERGARADGSHKVQHYTTSGTSAGWFMRAIKAVTSRREAYINEAKEALGL